jgi:dTDP-glucose 4,6-dehydratase
MQYLNILKYIARFNLVVSIWFVSGFCSLYFRYDGIIIFTTYLKIIPSTLLLTVVYLFITSLDRKLFGRAKKTTYEELFSVLRRYTFTGFLYFIFLIIYPNFILPKSFPILTTILALGLHLISRKVLSYILQRAIVRSNKIPVALYGAGTQTVSILNKISSDESLDWKPIVILEDDLSLDVNSINGIKVVKGLNIQDLIVKYNPGILIVTFANISNARLDELQNLCDDFSVQLKIISPIKAISGEDFKLSDIRTPTQEELIGKSSIKIELEQVKALIKGKVILVTGAGGSIGSELARQIDRYGPKKLYLLDRDESSLLDTHLDLINSSYILADIRDQVALSNALNSAKPEILVHAAALKHLNILEKYPDEGIKTNINGTNLVLQESLKIGVKTFINISTDKAADPISVLGKTKLIAERLTAYYANQASNIDSKFVSVRFGNVFGSRGSVIQTFQKQIDSGDAITITHPKVSRYFMTMEEAVHLVLRATIEGESGDTLILKMGKPILIEDIAKKLIHSSGKNIEIKYSDLQPGEKLTESLIAVREVPFNTKIEGVIKVRTNPLSPSDLPIDIKTLNLF